MRQKFQEQLNIKQGRVKSDNLEDGISYIMDLTEDTKMGY